MLPLDSVLVYKIKATVSSRAECRKNNVRRLGRFKVLSGRNQRTVAMASSIAGDNSPSHQRPGFARKGIREFRTCDRRILMGGSSFWTGIRASGVVVTCCRKMYGPLPPPVWSIPRFVIQGG